MGVAAPTTSPWLSILVIIFVAALVMRWFSAALYDFIIVRMTSRWYRVVLDRMHENQSLLDIGIGTATGLTRNKSVVKKKKLHVVGIDYEAAYIERAEKVLAWNRLSDLVRVRCKSIYDPGVPTLISADLHELLQKNSSEKNNNVVGDDDEDENKMQQRFDAAYFSGSLTLMPDPPAALKVAATMCKPGAPIYITQTFQLQHSPVAEIIKPLMKYLTTIDFGQLTYLSKLDEIASKAGMEIEANTPIEGSVQNRWQSARLVVMRSKE